jgi:hypothetical protein
MSTTAQEMYYKKSRSQMIKSGEWREPIELKQGFG